jgi:hypothetical protein
MVKMKRDAVESTTVIPQNANITMGYCAKCEHHRGAEDVDPNG